MTGTTYRINYAYVWRVCLVAAMGGFLFGYDWVVIGGAKPFYEAYFGIVGLPTMQGFTMSSALFGCILGAAISGIASDRWGRKSPLIFSGVLYTVSSIGTGLAPDLCWFNIFRIIGGVGIGFSSSISPMFIAETSPAESRGRFVSINQLTVVIGILAAQTVNLCIAQKVAPGSSVEAIVASWNGQLGWRWMFAAETIPAFLFFLFMFTVPESPRWLMKNRQRDQALSILEKIGGTDHAEREADEIEATLKSEQGNKPRLSELFDVRLRPVLFLGIYLAVYQQWCGINVIFNYAEDIFRAAGYEINDMMFNIVITGIVNLVFTFAAIAFVDRWGRRPLMLFGAASLGVIYVLMGIGYHFAFPGVFMLLLVLIAIACYAMTLAPIVWVVISEIFPNRVRGMAVSVAVCFLWIGCAALTFTFPLLQNALGASGTFGLYGLISLASFLVVVFRLRETKGESLEMIEKEFQTGDPQNFVSK